MQQPRQQAALCPNVLAWLCERLSGRHACISQDEVDYSQPAWHQHVACNKTSAVQVVPAWCTQGKELVKGRHWFGEEDRRQAAVLKTDKTGKQLLTILRHLKRIDEVYAICFLACSTTTCLIRNASLPVSTCPISCNHVFNCSLYWVHDVIERTAVKGIVTASVAVSSTRNAWCAYITANGTDNLPLSFLSHMLPAIAEPHQHQGSHADNLCHHGIRQA